MARIIPCLSNIIFAYFYFRHYFLQLCCKYPIAGYGLTILCIFGDNAIMVQHIWQEPHYCLGMVELECSVE